MYWPVFCDYFIILQWQPRPLPEHAEGLPAVRGKMPIHAYDTHIKKKPTHIHTSSRTPSLTEALGRCPSDYDTQESVNTQNQWFCTKCNATTLFFSSINNLTEKWQMRLFTGRCLLLPSPLNTFFSGLLLIHFTLPVNCSQYLTCKWNSTWGSNIFLNKNSEFCGQALSSGPSELTCLYVSVCWSQLCHSICLCSSCIDLSIALLFLNSDYSHKGQRKALR